MLSAPMRGRIAIFAAVAAAAIALVLVLVLGVGGQGPKHGGSGFVAPGEPKVEIISPRNGERQASHAVVVGVQLHNFRLAPEHFRGEPEIGEGYLRFALNRVLNCVSPKRLRKAMHNPLGRGRVIGPSFDYPQYSGPNGELARRIGSAGSSSPATRPVIYYHDLPSGFYRIVVSLAANNGGGTPFHAVTDFQVTYPPGRGPAPCRNGKVPGSKAAGNLG
jgi:hypothetical protein